MELGRGRPLRLLSTAWASDLLCVSLCFFCVCAVLAHAGRTTNARSVTGDSCGRGNGSPVQRVATEAKREEAAGRTWWRSSAMTAARRNLAGGPGSYPPRCTSKCGECTPCKPVHVPFPPGMPVIAEYYPEAWRCKCGDKLYMP